MNPYNQNSKATVLCRVFLEYLLVFQSVRDFFLGGGYGSGKFVSFFAKISPFDLTVLDKLRPYVHEP
jgi:hypothetical protein